MIPKMGIRLTLLLQEMAIAQNHKRELKKDTIAVAYKLLCIFALSVGISSCSQPINRLTKTFDRLASPGGTKELVFQSYAQDGISPAYIAVNLNVMNDGKRIPTEGLVHTTRCKNLRVRWLDDNTVGVDFDEIDQGQMEMNRTMRFGNAQLVDMREIEITKGPTRVVSIPDCLAALGISSAGQKPLK